MTLILARRFGDRIMMVADTKISDSQGITRAIQHDGVVRSARIMHDCVPGRLKILPLSEKISIGYAGSDSNLALDIIRHIAKNFDIINDIDGINEKLLHHSKGSDFQFITVAHVRGPEIFKISNNAISGNQEIHWIGDPEAVPLFNESEKKISEMYSKIGDALAGIREECGSIDERKFTSAWMDLLMKSPRLTETVGGLPVMLLCSPKGHVFNPSAGAYNPDAITVGGSPGGTFNRDGLQVDALYGQYSYSLMGPSGRGVPVLGVWLQESAKGYLYDPLGADSPALFQSMNELRGAISSASEKFQK